MEAAIETNCRRAIQVAYNTEHGIEHTRSRCASASRDVTEMLAREDADTDELGAAGTGKPGRGKGLDPSSMAIGDLRQLIQDLDRPDAPGGGGSSSSRSPPATATRSPT